MFISCQEAIDNQNILLQPDVMWNLSKLCAMYLMSNILSTNFEACHGEITVSKQTYQNMLTLMSALIFQRYLKKNNTETQVRFENNIFEEIKLFSL